MVKFEGALTYTRLRDGEDCMLLFKLRHIEKRKEQESAALQKGSKIHEHLESYLKGHVGVVIDYAEPMRLELKQLKAMKGLRTEEAWGYDEQWQPLPVTGYYSKQDRVRAKIDALVLARERARVIDFKSGRVREASKDQVRFYGLLTLLRHPVKLAELELWFVEHQEGKREYEPVLRKQVPTLLEEYKARFARVYDERDFKATPGLHCKFCPFSKYKGGPCRVG